MKNIINKISSLSLDGLLSLGGLQPFGRLSSLGGLLSLRGMLSVCLCAGLLSLSSCGKEKQPEAGITGLDGEWRLESFSNVPASEEEIDVYIKFEKGSFELFQKLGGGHYSKYDGKYSISGSELSGKYSDGVAFGSNYHVEIDGDTMTMHSTASSASKADRPSTTVEVCVYVRSEIPESVRRDAADYAGTRSSEAFDDAVDLPEFPWNGNLLRAM